MYNAMSKSDRLFLRRMEKLISNWSKHMEEYIRTRDYVTTCETAMHCATCGKPLASGSRVRVKAQWTTDYWEEINPPRIRLSPEPTILFPKYYVESVKRSQVLVVHPTFKDCGIDTKKGDSPENFPEGKVPACIPDE
jgi:hypothetical protein